MKKVILLFVLLFSVSIINANTITPHVSSVHTTPHINPAHATPRFTAHITPHVSKPVAHVSSSHVSSSHVSPVNPIAIHEMPTYHPIKTVNESHIYLNKNTALYYYLIINNHTHKYDTISAPSKDELKSKVLNTTKSGRDEISKVIMVLCATALIILSFLLFSSIKKGEEEKY